MGKSPQRSFSGDVLVNLIFMPLMVGVSLISVPLYLAQIGIERYGVLTLVWVLTGMFAFFDLGMGAATNYLVARARNGLDGPPISTVVRTTGLANLAIGSILALAFWLVLGSLLFGNVKTEATLDAEVSEAIVWISFLLPVSMVSSILRNALDGARRFFASNLIAACGNVSTVISTLCVAFLWGPELPKLMATVFVARCLMLLAYVTASWRMLNRGRLMTQSEMRETLRFGGWQVIFSGVSGVLGAADRFIIGWIAGASATSMYAIPMGLTGRLRFLPTAILRSLYPRLSEVKSDTERRQLAARALTGMLGTMAAFTIPALLFVRPFFGVWLGPAFASNMGVIAQLLLLGVFIQSCLQVVFVLQRSLGRPDVPAQLRLVTCLPLICVLIFLVWAMGAIGAAIALISIYFVELCWVLHISGMLQRSLPRIIGYLGLCALAISISTISYNIIVGTFAAGAVFIALSVFALRQSDDLSRFAARVMPHNMVKKVTR